MHAKPGKASYRGAATYLLEPTRWRAVLPTTGMRAFISYSHVADGTLAPQLQSALHGFAKPWYRLRAIRVFRDKTSLSATPSLWPSIEAALRNSKFLLFLASPDAAKSHWVNKEIETFLQPCRPQATSYHTH